MSKQKDVPVQYYSEEILMRGGATGLTRLAIAVDSPVPVSEFSPQGQVILQMLVANAAAEDMALMHDGKPTSLPEYHDLLRRVGEMLKQPMVTPAMRCGAE